MQHCYQLETHLQDDDLLNLLFRKKLLDLANLLVVAICAKSLPDRRDQMHSLIQTRLFCISSSLYQ